ncbi:oligosaccharide flippase family protein, partial [Calditrichota bacterium]
MDESIQSRFLRGIFSTGFARLLNLVLSLLSLMLVIRYISAEAYGAFVLIRVICIFLSEVSNFGLTLALPKYLASSETIQYKFRLINTVIYFRIFIIFLFSFLIFLVKPGLAVIFGSSPLMLSLYIYLPVLFGFVSLGRTSISILQGLFRFKMMGIISSISTVANFIAIIIFVFVLNLSTLGLIFALIVSNSLIIILSYVAFRISDKFSINLSILKEMLVFGLPLQVQYILDFTFTRIDTIIIGSFLGTAGVAFYEVARKLPDSCMYLYDAFRSVFYPFIAKLYNKGEKRRLEKLLNNSNRLLAFITSLGTLIAVLFGKDIISLLFSQEYLTSYYAFVFLMFGLNLSVLDNTLGYSLVAIGEPKKPLIVNLVRATVSSVLNLIITPIYSFTGASIVTVISNLFAVPMDLYFLRN